MNLPSALNYAWMLSCRGQWRQFCRAAGNVAAAQAKVLRQILEKNQATDFGKQHGFSQSRTPEEFQQRTPVGDYGAMAPWIERVAVGEPNVITKDPFRLFEPTSGTSGGEKLIPYTKSLAEQFQLAIGAWIYNLMSTRPAVRRGTAYWSISPALGQRRATAGGIPIGFEDDTAYLGYSQRLAVKTLLAVPSAVTLMQRAENFKYATLLHLISRGDLALISVWSPTFLTTLLESLDDWSEQLCWDLSRGRLSLPCSELPDIVAPNRPRPNPRRADMLQSVFRNECEAANRLRDIWPRLALISCWADASASGYASALRKLFPGVELQPKGLIATEAFISFPLADSISVSQPGAALALCSHFFEFVPLDSPGANQVCLAHQLRLGETYQVIVTTGGGLYRYQMNDVVEVVGFHQQCPLLRFLGRGGSDRVGEKLSEPHVRSVLQRVFTNLLVTPSFTLMAPVEGTPPETPHYRLYIQCTLPKIRSKRWLSRCKRA